MTNSGWIHKEDLLINIKSVNSTFIGDDLWSYVGRESWELVFLTEVIGYRYETATENDTGPPTPVLAGLGGYAVMKKFVTVWGKGLHTLRIGSLDMADPDRVHPTGNASPTSLS